MVIAEQWDRTGQFYASLESGHKTASIPLKCLASCTAKNRFYRANRDLGRVFKSDFLLSYLSEPQMRSRIRLGLSKVEQLHALARDVYYGRWGRISARELRADELVQLPDADSGMRVLLAGQRDLADAVVQSRRRQD